MGKAKKISNISSESADRLGELRAEMAFLKKEAKVHEDIIKNSGLDVVEGRNFRVTVSRMESKKIDWKSIALKLKASDYMKKAYSKISNSVRLNVNAHKK